MLSVFKRYTRELFPYTIRAFKTDRKFLTDTIDPSRFEDGLLQLYRAKETNTIRLFNTALLGYIGYGFYSYSKSEDPLYSSPDGLLSIFMLGVLTVLEMKNRRSPKAIYLQKDGKNVILELYRFFGLTTKSVLIPCADFHGTGFYYSKKLNLPCAKYVEGKKKKYLFYRPRNGLELEILKKVFDGHDFSVENPELNIKLSKKTRQKYGL